MCLPNEANSSLNYRRSNVITIIMYVFKLFLRFTQFNKLINNSLLHVLLCLCALQLLRCMESCPRKNNTGIISQKVVYGWVLLTPCGGKLSSRGLNSGLYFFMSAFSVMDAMHYFHNHRFGLRIEIVLIKRFIQIKQMIPLTVIAWVIFSELQKFSFLTAVVKNNRHFKQTVKWTIKANTTASFRVLN